MPLHPDMSHHSILLIENDPGMQLLLMRFLLEIGYKDDDIVICEDLSQILSLPDDNFKVIITKPAFTDSTCEQTLITIQDKFSFTPVVVVSDTSDLETEMKVLQQGAFDFLIKGEFEAKGLQKSIWRAIIRNREPDGFMKLFDENPVPMYIYDQSTYRFLAVNKAALQQYGYTLEEFLSLHAGQIRPEGDIQDFIKANRDAPETNHDFGQWRHLRKSGELFYVHIYAHTTEFKNKKAMLVFAVDVDNKVKSELALREKAEEINVILNSITDAFFAVNHKWEFTFVNKVFEQSLQSTKEQIIGKNLWDIFPQAKTLKFFHEYNRAVNDQVSVHFEEHEPVYDIWVSVNAYPTKDGLAVYCVDITEQKNIQEKIFNDEQNLRAIINNTKDIIWSIDKDYNIISANQAFWERLALIKGNNDPTTRDHDFTPDLIEQWQQYLIKAFEGEAYKTIRRDEVGSKEVFEEISFNPIFDINNEVIGISCFSRDVTEQLNYIKKIEHQNEQLTQIAWIQSHEVRHPVASILGLIKLFNRDDKNDADNVEILDKVEEAAMELDKVIRKITKHTKVTRL